MNTSVILALSVIFVGIFWWIRNERRKKYYRNTPGPPTVPFFGNALDFKTRADVLPSLLKYVTEFGGKVKVRVGPLKEFLLLTDYKMLEFVLSSDKILKKSDGYRLLDNWLGGGLLIGSGSKYEKHRKILTPAFHFEILENFVANFESCGEILIGKLSQQVGKTSVDIYPFVTLCTLDVICESTMGISINAQDDISSEYVQSVKEMSRIINDRHTKPTQMFFFTYVFTKNYRIEKQAIDILHKKAKSVISKRIELPKIQKTAFLNFLLETTVDGKKLSETDIWKEIDTLIFTGHDTTASAISFALYCLATHPEVQQSVFEEQQLIFEGESQPVTYSHLQSMKYLEQVIKETLRLYPSAPIIGREFDEDLHYENTCLPKGDSLLMFTFGIHRNSDYWPNPELFDPGRFENVDGRFPYAYIPFSAGPRNCIGQKFAMLEMKSIISKIIRKFELRPATPKHSLQLVAETVLKSANGIKISLHLRS